jgi:hypothetical protein
MRNRLSIRQADRLAHAAYELTALRAATLPLGLPARGLPHLCAIHRHLYQDIFDWAGEIREIDIYQGDTRFCHFAYIEKEGNALMQESTGFWHDDFSEATPNDICVAVRTHDVQPAILDLIREQLEKELSAITSASGNSSQLVKARRWESACQKLPQSNLLLVSVAGEYAASVAREGLLADKNVMLFSDNVPVAQEVELKTLARERGLKKASFNRKLLAR